MPETPHKGPLQGLKVIDLSRFIAGPYAAMLMADHGADVIKVEKPVVGEETRRNRPLVRGESLYYMMFNRNKRGITLNLRSQEGLAILRSMIQRCDVLIDGFKPGTLKARGLPWEELQRLNPRLVLAAVSGYGQDGPYAQRPGFDPIAQAMSGIMAQTGTEGGRPIMSGVFIADYGTALYVLSGVLMALYERQCTGRGQIVDSALLDSAVSFLCTSIPEYALLGQDSTRRGNRSRYVAPNEMFPTKDAGEIYIVGGHDNHFSKLASLVGRPEIAKDLRFATTSLRFDHYDELCEVIRRWTQEHTAAEALGALAKAGIPAGKVSRISDLVKDPQIKHRQMIVEMDHPVAGKVPMQGVPFKLSSFPQTTPRSSPTLGEHTEEVLSEWLGLTSSQVEEYRRAGVV